MKILQVYSTFRENLKIARNAKKMTLLEVEKALGIKEYNLSRIETGAINPKLHIAIALADFFHFSLQDLQDQVK